MPVGAPEPKAGKPSSAPPASVLWLLARLHPELRRRAKTARRAIDQKVWHEDRLRWEQHDRAAMLAANRALQSEDLDRFDDDALVDHVRRAAANMEHGIVMHMALIPVQDVTVGRLLLACRTWGIADADTIALLGGSSPASMASAAGLAAIAQACRDAGVEPATLDDVRAAGPEAAAALDHYLADHGWRPVTQYSPRGVCLVELPDLLVEAIRAAAADTEPPRRDRSGTAAGAVPESDRARFDDLLADARECFGVRDDNVALTFLWPCGLVRRALLEAGRRLAARGLLQEDWHVFGLGEDEVVAALSGDETLAEVAAARAERGMAAEAEGAPLQLGDDEGPPPDPGLFPSAMAELVRSIMVGFELEQAMLGAPKEVAAWTGDGIGIGSTALHGPGVRRGVGRGRPRPPARRRRPRHNADHPHLRSHHADRRRRGHRVRRVGRPHRHRLPGVRHPRGRRRRRRHHPHRRRRPADRRSVDRPGARRRRVDQQPLRSPTSR